MFPNGLITISKSSAKRSDYQDFERSIYPGVRFNGFAKAIKGDGNFCSTFNKDNKAGYLADIPLVMDYFLEIGQKYQELEPFMLWFNDNVVDNVKVKIQRKEMLEL